MLLRTLNDRPHPSTGHTKAMRVGQWTARVQEERLRLTFLASVTVDMNLQSSMSDWEADYAEGG
jgi:hypothetical protein